MDALEKINQLFYRESKTVLFNLWRQAVSDPYVQQAGLECSQEEFRYFLNLVRTGLTYVAGKYGPGAIPEDICFLSYIKDEKGEGVVTGTIAYHPDVSGVSSIYITSLYALRMIGGIRDSGFFSSINLGGTGLIDAQEWTVLGIIEECYHHLQHRRGLRPRSWITLFDRNDPLELEVKPILLTAIADLHFKIREVPEGVVLQSPTFRFGKL